MTTLTLKLRRGRIKLLDYGDTPVPEVADLLANLLSLPNISGITIYQYHVELKFKGPVPETTKTYLEKNWEIEEVKSRKYKMR
jgi:hypothetical protein